MLDIDKFKEANDAHGHPFGDHVLQEVSRIMKENVRDIDLATGRILVAPGFSDPA